MKNLLTPSTLPRDLAAGAVVFLVALPLCLGVAVASAGKEYVLSGLIAGIVGGLVVGILSGSHASVSGPAAGLTAVVAAQIVLLGSFQAFLAAVVIAGVIQIILGVLRAGFISFFFPTSVIKGLLAAIGIIIILKQIPHLVGHDTTPEDDMSFQQPSGTNTFSELWATIYDLHTGAMLVGLTCLAVLIVWNKIKWLKNSGIPAPLVVVVLGVIGGRIFRSMGEPFTIGTSHLVQVPVFDSFASVKNVLHFPDFSLLTKGTLWIAAFTIAIVASLETLLNLEAVDKLDPQKRISPPNRELLAQGCGNIVSGMLGGLPVTSVIIRSSVNLNAGARTRLSAIFHGVLLLGLVAYFPTLLNEIPLSVLAAILIVTGWKLASKRTVKQMYAKGWSMFLPFAATVIAIVTTDLLIGTLIGLAVSIAFILRSNVRKPLHRVLEKHVAGDVLHIQLANQVSFLNRAMLFTTLEEVPEGGHVLIDARETDYIDPDILDLIRTFEKEEAPVRNITVSLIGFHEDYAMEDRILYADFTPREVRDAMTPDRVLDILREGNERFRAGQPLNTRNLRPDANAEPADHAPLAAVLSCIDTRTPTELVFDLGPGDAFTVRIAGNIADGTTLGSLEYACAVAGAKLILVMGHTRCGAIHAAVECTLRPSDQNCRHLNGLVQHLQKSIDPGSLAGFESWNEARQNEFLTGVAGVNARQAAEQIRNQSSVLNDLAKSGAIRIVAAVYDVSTGQIAFAE